MKIGILYNLVESIERGLEIDKLSDNEIIDTVNDVKKVLDNKHEVIPVRINRDLFSRLSSKSFDFVFNFCEGIDGNVNGEPWIPAILDMIGIKYTGSDSFTLGLCLDKIKTKQILIANNILTPKYQIFYNLHDLNMPDLLDSNLKFPLIVKPSHEDASVGISSDSVVRNERDLRKKAEYILNTYNQPALVEEYIDGRELSVAVIGNGDSIDVLPVSEVVFNFDEGIPKIDSYESKWLKGSYAFQKTEIVCPAKLPEAIEDQIKKLAVCAYNIAGCRDYATVDLRLKDSSIYILEINPNPSIGIKTGLVESANHAGVSYEELINRIFSGAMKRYNFNDRVSEKKPLTITHTSQKIIADSIKTEHVPLLVKWFNDPDALKYMDSPADVYSDDDIIENFLVLNQEDINLIISEKESKTEIGYCSIYNIKHSNQSAEISFLIGEKQFQRKGYGREIIRLLLSIGFDNICLNSIFATVTQKNERSIRLFEWAGFRKVGVMRQYHFLKDEKLDEFFFEMLKEDYMQLYGN